jgi:HTH-type transcriptional regulator/antitoxin HipB
MNFLETGTLVRAAREKAGLTQADLARALGMSRATISQVENGVIKELGVRKLALLLDRLGLEIVVRLRRPLGLHETYEKNRKQRREAFQETDAALDNLKPDIRG